MTKAKTCRQCSTQFVPFNTTDLVCSVKCAVDYVKQSNEIKQAKAWRKEKLERKKALKTKSDWLKEAQNVFNTYIRERDKDKACISCGREPKKRNAGHYRSVGAHPELRFTNSNCAVQCEHCNSYLSGNIAEYRKGLLERIGEERLAWLEGPHQAQHWDITDIQEIKAWYKEQLKVLKNE